MVWTFKRNLFSSIFTSNDYLLSCQLVLMAKSADECYPSNLYSTTFVRSCVVQNFLNYRNLTFKKKKKSNWRLSSKKKLCKWICYRLAPIHFTKPYQHFTTRSVIMKKSCNVGSNYVLNKRERVRERADRIKTRHKILIIENNRQRLF